ncbi:MAG: hypothetical protein IPP51_08245 [Bacteroidetes bacterium]|nr:hypothetical protein [Bacteroidota bacterium]
MPITENIIYLPQAALLVKNLLNEPILANVTNLNSLGATMELESLHKNLALYKGTLAWFCHIQGNVPAYFIAMEERTDVDPNNYPTEPISEGLSCPDSFFNYNGGIDLSSVQKFLEDHTTDINSVSDYAVSKADVIEYSGSFMLNFPRDENDEPYNHYPFGFFEDGTDHDIENAFLGIPGIAYFRYYFGFDSRDRPNRLRLILVAVDKDGKNITRISPTGDYAPMIQKSWPPSN